MWSAEMIAQERQERLRALLRVAQERSPWHAARLRGIDPDTFREDGLSRLPPMNKSDLMASWDAIVTDRRVTLDQADAHVSGLTSDAYLQDDLHVVASGGSSGHRGVFVYGWQEWATAYVGLPRALLWDRAVSPELAGLPSSVGLVAAQNASHMTSSMAQTFAHPEMQVACFPVTRSMSEIVAGLNAFQPTVLAGYASALALLAVEARAGRLQIAPRRVQSTSEPLLPQVRLSVEEAFGAPVANVWGISEAGAMGVGCWRSPGMHLCDDLVIVEPVDQAGNPVPVGTRSDAIYITVLTNSTLPLIRYHITDQMTFLAEPCPCGSAHQRIADVEGRLDDIFTYAGGITVHPHLFRSALLKETSLVEYQVRQTPRGAEILVIGSLRDRTSAARTLESELSRVGLPHPTISFHPVDSFDRQASGKVRRFLPLA
jgi:phenylacetate-coenzyme A ligase PaaK-like adenylate-forming protein